MPGAFEMTENEAVLAVDDARLQAMIASDVDALDRLSAAELVFVHANGRQEDKPDFLAAARSGHIRYKTIVRGETTIKVTGDVAILCASIYVDVTVAGEPRSSPVRYMSVWTKRAGEWKLLAIDVARPPAD
jgi:ketosteroid isomerase-like protein